MEILTPRFVLRDFVEEDRKGFLDYQTDPRTAAYSGPEETGVEHATRLFDTFLRWAAEHPRRNYQLAIVLRKPPCALVGCGGLRMEGQAEGEAELGIELAPDYWGRYGYAVEVGEALLAFGFGELNLTAISGITISANERITRLASWFGAEIVASRPPPDWMSEREWRLVAWRITREQWKSHPRRSRL